MRLVEYAAILGFFRKGWNPIGPQSVSCPEPDRAPGSRHGLFRKNRCPLFPDHVLGCSPRIEILPSIARVERFSMTLTVAHISPIISLIAGVLILIMPRLLNLIVAIFLILNGLLGLGLLKWLHL